MPALVICLTSVGVREQRRSHLFLHSRSTPIVPTEFASTILFVCSSMFLSRNLIFVRFNDERGLTCITRILIANLINPFD